MLLLSCPWSFALDTIKSTQLESVDGRIMFRGLRAKVGLFLDYPLEVTPHGSTGRADYFGTFVNRCARMMIGAQGGQILGPEDAIADAVQDWMSNTSDTDIRVCSPPITFMEQLHNGEPCQAPRSDVLLDRRCIYYNEQSILFE